MNNFLIPCNIAYQYATMIAQIINGDVNVADVENVKSLILSDIENILSYDVDKFYIVCYDISVIEFTTNLNSIEDKLLKGTSIMFYGDVCSSIKDELKELLNAFRRD